MLVVSSPFLMDRTSPTNEWKSRNPFLQAENCENLFAAGDVCAYPAVKTGQRVRIEHWDVAMQQGRIAACNMLGKFQPFTTTPFFWSGTTFRETIKQPTALPELFWGLRVVSFGMISWDASGKSFS